MKTLTTFLLCVILTLVAADARSQTDAKVASLDISRLMPKNRDYFTKVAGSESWTASYRGKNLASVVVTIMGVKEGDSSLLLFQTTLGDRENIPLSRNLAVKLLELNGDYDFAKVVLYDKFLALRIDYSMAGLDATAVEKICDQLASTTDAAYGEIKNFLP